MAKLRTQRFDSVFPTYFPITDGIETYSVTLGGFDRDKGFLVGATIQFAQTLTSTAFFTDPFGSGFASFGTAYTNVAGNYSTKKGQPDLWATDMALSAIGSTVIFGTATAPVNAATLGFGIFTDTGQFRDDKAIKVTLDTVGGFSGFPFATLPQGDVVIGAEVTYSFVKYRDIINGNGKDNKITGTNKVDVIRGKDGDDRMSGGKDNDYLIGGKGKDRLFGGAGEDSLDGGKGKDKLFGGGKIDVLSGDQKADILKGGGSGDYLFGGAGGDRLFGGKGGDILDGGRGNDKMFGGKGDDAVYGGGGNDRLDGGNGTDFYTGGGGADTFVLRKNDAGGAYVKDFGRGDDKIDISDFNVKRKDVKVYFNENADDFVLEINGTAEAVLENIERSDITNEMIIL